MKNLIAKILTRLNSIPKDKYQHFAVGAVLAAVALIVAHPLQAWWRWFPLLVSMIAVVTAAVVKERRIDHEADLYDILWTLAGGGVVWIIELMETL